MKATEAPVLRYHSTPARSVQRQRRLAAFGLRWLSLSILALTVSASESVEAQDPAELFADRVDVRLHNVDVVVTDRDGRPVRGLVRADFELRVAGKPIDIESFSESRSESRQATLAGVDSPASRDAPQDRTEDPAETGDSAGDARPVLVILVDGQSLLPAARARLLDDISSALDSLIEASRGVVVASLGSRLHIDQTISRDRQALSAALDEIASRAPIRADDLSFLIRKIERGEVPVPGDEEQMDRAEAEARALLGELRSTAWTQRYAITGASRQLRQLIGALGTLSGRSCVLFLSQGMATLPAEIAYRVWWQKYGVLARELGVSDIDSEIQRSESGSELRQVLDLATANRVTFYVVSDGDDGKVNSVLFSSETPLEARRLAFDDPRANLATLALVTGGESARSASRNGHLIDLLTQDLGNYYSLAFDPAKVAKETGRVRVRLSGAEANQWTLRYLRDFQPARDSSRLVDAALASLHFDIATNQHQVAVEVAPVRQVDNHLRLPLLVKVPMARLTLMPRTDRHVGQLSLALVSFTDRGGTSPTLQARVPIEIENTDLLAAMSQIAAARLELDVVPGRQKIAIAVRDDVGETYSTVNLMIDTENQP